MVENAAAIAATHIVKNSSKKITVFMACASLVDVNILADLEQLV